MSEFSLEYFAGKIHYGKTKDYFQEVLSSYQNGNYRSAVVMLWSVAICDILYKLQNLVDLYEDPVAKAILDELMALQSSDPKSASWEIKLVDDTCEKTSLLNISEYENLRYLQKQRHLSAHPILNSNRELHTPNKETVRALIRNTLEDLLVKPPFYTQKITDELLSDIAESAPAINTRKKLKRYVESRYLNRMKPEVEVSIYRTLWKLVFKLENEDCTKNRNVNLQTLEVIGDRSRESVLEKIRSEADYYSNISSRSQNLDFLVFYLSKNPGIYAALNEDAKLKIQFHIENTNLGKLCGWFVKDSIGQHYNDVLSLIEGDTHLELVDGQLEYLLQISDTKEWQNLFCRILSAYYCASRGFNQADARFDQAISPYIDLFGQEELLFLIQCIEGNDQVYRRGKAYDDHLKIKDKLFQWHEGDFDLTPYPRFKEHLALDQQ
jgi:hypothetical protein